MKGEFIQGDTYEGSTRIVGFWLVGLLDRFNAGLGRGNEVVEVSQCLKFFRFKRYVPCYN